MNEKILPILPIPDVVFFPHTSLPLYVEDKIYVRMILEAVEAGQEVVISLARPTRPIFGNVNKQIRQYRPATICSAGQPVILDNFNDKALKVIVKGTQRVRLLGAKQLLPYPVFETINYPDAHVISGTNLDNIIHTVSSKLENWVEQNVRDSQERESFFKNLLSVNHMIDYSAMLMIRDTDIRQLILECDNLLERVFLVAKLLENKEPLKEDIQLSTALKKFEIYESMAKLAM